MNPLSRYAMMLAPLVLVACSKKIETAPGQQVVVPVAAAPAAVPAAAPAAAPAPVPATPVDPANMTAEQREMAQRQAKLDFATEEDKYMNDPLAQWASGVTASGSYGNPEPVESWLPGKLVGAVDGKYWKNKNRDIGFEWVQLDYAKPVNATEVRLVVDSGSGVQSLNKVELQDIDGKWNTVWTGLSDVKPDPRGPRTWFVKTFPKTAYKVKAVKYTIANNVHTGDKDFDAAQLVGE